MDGQANSELVRYMSKVLDVRKSDISLDKVGVKLSTNEPRHKNTGLWGIQLGLIQTGPPQSQKMARYLNFAFKKQRSCYILVGKTKTLVSCVGASAQLICVFVFAYEKAQFSHDVAHLSENFLGKSRSGLGCVLGVMLEIATFCLTEVRKKLSQKGVVKPNVINYCKFGNFSGTYFAHFLFPNNLRCIEFANECSCSLLGSYRFFVGENIKFVRQQTRKYLQTLSSREHFRTYSISWASFSEADHQYKVHISLCVRKPTIWVFDQV